MDHPP